MLARRPDHRAAWGCDEAATKKIVKPKILGLGNKEIRGK